MSDETESIEDVVGKLVQEYLELGSLVDEMETQQDQIKDKMSAILRPGAEGAPSSWVFPTGEVSWVKGRKSERLDQGVLRKALVLAGVDVALVRSPPAAVAKKDHQGRHRLEAPNFNFHSGRRYGSAGRIQASPGAFSASDSA